MPQCVYCFEEKSNECFRKIEHVLPQSFGTFEKNFTLRGTVCDECNQYFGNHLELALARDSYEGLSRFTYRVRDPDEFRPFGRGSRIIIRLREGTFEGAYAYREYSPEAGEVVLQPLPQVGFLNGAGKYEYFLPDDIPTQERLKELGFNLKHQRSICGIAMDEATLRGMLAERGIEFKHRGEVVPPEKSRSILCEVEGTIDRQIFRAIAKIAFNYLLYWAGPHFLLEQSFNPVRRYIRYGESPGYALVAVRENAILADEPLVGERRLGHLITSNWAENRNSIVGQVSLFNWVTYCVSLLRDYSGERRVVKRGHFFDVSNRRILELETRP
jgi:hypothetical protein